MAIIKVCSQPAYGHVLQPLETDRHQNLQTVT